MRGDGISPHDEQDVADDKADGVPATDGVPTGKPIRTDAAFESRNSRHEEKDDADRVAGEQPGDPATVGKPVTHTAHVWGAAPPEKQHRDGTKCDAEKHD